jgi:hypothetical protein
MSKPKLPAPVTAVTIEGISLVKPSLYLRLSAKKISAILAPARYTQPIFFP